MRNRSLHGVYLIAVAREIYRSQTNLRASARSATCYRPDLLLSKTPWELLKFPLRNYLMSQQH
jgi:hypothetical protein